MRVICVNNSPSSPNNEPCIELVEGQVYIATNCKIYKHCFRIKNHSYCPIDGRPVSYLKSRFIPLSNIDETQLHINSVKEVEA